ncbi:SDR family oxidoreductase [Catalinimonas niigatensis]|uniref:SDR family oxidoreductase n=1 Tax=Catalinimonas niigatensis TaxID=1397264 RepID=UPI00266709FA|nr:SDR family oxidoreductase [Catalinimonas niigatensis]WPP52462.1 SDR family oxidoreductase [Catalinimonas niigatensis]
MQRLKGQAALITGASSGIGQGIAIAMAREGALVGINYSSSEDGARTTLKEVKAAGSEGLIIQADVSDPDSVENMFAQFFDRFGTIDILVSNSGIQKDAPFLEMSFDDWQKVLAINLSGQFLCAQHAAREFIRRGVIKEKSKAAGKIICMSSVHDIIPWAGHINYATAKGGVMMFMKTLAQELAHHKIRVNSLSPGAIKTPINEEVWKDEAQRKELLKLIPYQRIGGPEDIGDAAVWLASDESDYVNGHTLYVDGGMTLYPGFIGNG